MSDVEWTRQDTITLLQWIAAHNGREPGKSDVLVWTAAAQAGRWVPRYANEAVTQFHLRNAGRLITPADVHEYVRVKKEDEASREELEQVKKKRPVRELLAGAVEKWALPAGDDDTPAVEPEVGADCPWCKATDGESCGKRGPNGWTPVRPHDSRHDALMHEAQALHVEWKSDSSEQCPTCAAPAGRRCVNIVTGRYRLRGPHGERAYRE